MIDMIEIIDTLMKIIKLVIAILPFVILCLMSKKVNLPKTERSKQFFMPVIAVVYVIIAMLLLNRVNGWLLDFIENLPKRIVEFSGWEAIQSPARSFLIQLGSTIRSILKKLNLNFWIFFISNLVFLAVYLFIKKIAIAIMAKVVKSDSELHSKIAGYFYEFFVERNKWCIKENYVQVRGLLKVFYYSAVVLSAILMLISREFYFDNLIKSVFYPVFGIIVVGELYFYLDGTTKREYSGHILGEDEDAYRTVNYSLLRKFLRSVFGDKLLTENTSIHNSMPYDLTTDDIIQELEKDEDQKITCFASYIDALNKTGTKIDHNYLYSSLDMLNGKSVLFNNPFYNDLIPYAFYPMNRTLLSHQKVLVVLGRHSIEDDIKEWLQKGIEAITNIPFMWNIGVLDKTEQDLDIGIVTRSDVLDIEMHNANSEFLENVGFFLIIEPSKLISTSQIGLNLLVKKCKTAEDKNIVYCMCDKNCDGLVDAMSHILMTSITEVSATQKHLGTSSYMCWDADEEYLHHRLVPNISRYLGMGTELSFAALKNQVSKAKWYGGEMFPVIDMRWIDKQYYYDLTKYASLPTNQEAMDEYFIATPNFWSAEVERNSYITIEDESYNMFELLRDFSTRATEQGFINIISSEYLLKDYMADNASIFETDAKAIPYIVADYTRSNRNTILRLLLMMSTFPITSEILEKEFSLIGISTFNLKKQLWFELYNCYADVSEVTALPDDYREAVEMVYEKSIIINGTEWLHNIIKVEEKYNLKCGKSEISYSISDKKFLEQCVFELRSAGYISEDEKGQRYYLGSELRGHIYQKYLPGQFFTFGGKYYEMQYLTADGHVMVRRAADHITGRPTYRQIRNYTIHGVKPSVKIGAQQNVSGLKIIKEFADISVETPGYYRMEKYNDFTSSKCIHFEGEKNGIPKRVYRNKEILRIELPDFDGKLNDNIRYTITVLFNEVFKTIFAENQAYICAVTDDSFIGENESHNPLTYSVCGDGVEIQKNSIYIIEDSQLDLGLTVAVERNLERIFSIIHDYLDWHVETLENSLNPPTNPQSSIVFTDEEEEPKKKGLAGIKQKIKKFFEKIKNFFKRKRKKKGAKDEVLPPVDGETPEQPEEPVDETSPEGAEPSGEEGEQTPENAEPSTENGEQKPEEGNETPTVNDVVEDDANDNIKVDVDADSGENTKEQVSDIGNSAGEVVENEPVEKTECPSFDGVSSSEDEENDTNPGFDKEKKPYHNRYYLLYGGDCEFQAIDVPGTLNYLAEMEIGLNSLKQAREGKKIAEIIEATYKPGKPDARYCDFCGTEIYGVEYETLADGRDRCLNCGRTAIKTGEDFRKLFEDVKRNMESSFGIRINAGIKVEMVNSKTLHKRLKKAFIPTPKSDGRVLGVAISDKDGYTLLVENGSPRMASMLTMAHELTHIWQYINWNDKAIRKKYGKRMRLEIYEGMAKWVEIQFAYLLNEAAIAKREEIITSYRDDEYGHGFLRYRANYPFSLGTVITKRTPFMNIDTPLDLEYCGKIKVIEPTDAANSNENDGDNSSSGGAATPTAGRITGPIERNPDSVNMYAYNLLGDEEKSVYDLIKDAINDFVSEIDAFPAYVTKDAVQKIVDYIQRDHPEIFWFQHGATFYFDSTTQVVSKLELKYCMTKEEAEKRKKKIESATRVFLTSIKDNMSDYEVTLRIYENIIGLVDYDTIGLETQKRNDISPEVPDDLRSIYGVFVNKKAVCSGYAKAMQYLLNLCGIECTYVTSATHAWNLVKLEGDYYHLDVTWGDGSDTKKQGDQRNSMNYDCFCITSEELSRLDSHVPETDFPIPECTATKCNYHRRHGLYFETFDFDRVRAIVCKSAQFNCFDISFKFASENEFNEANKKLIEKGKFKEIIKYVTLKTGIKLDTSYMYSMKADRLIANFYLKKM